MSISGVFLASPVKIMPSGPAAVLRGVGPPLERGGPKWNVWHGNVFRALEHCDGLTLDLEGLQAADDPEPQSPAIPKLYKAVGEFRHYLDANRAFIPNYGDRYRQGEPISSAPVEATVNQVVTVSVW